MTWWVEWASGVERASCPFHPQADCPNTGYPENEGESVPEAALATTYR
ncbi:hypothetical protein [Moorena producens]